MNTNCASKSARLIPAAIFSFLSLFPVTLCLGQTDPSTPPYSVVERGPYYRILQRTVSVTNSVTGAVSPQVQSYTELEDGMHYLSNGQWVEAQDLIEVTADGAVATRGQMKASFKSDITSPAAISLVTAAGEVFQSHPVGLFYADRVSGKLARIAAVQPSQGMLYPPNVIVFSNVLAGLRADLMLVWTKGGYEQNLVLKQAPPPPGSFGLSSSDTTLQFWSAMDSCPVPQEQRPVLLKSGLEDHILIFASSWFPVGAAFSVGDAPLPPAGEAARIRLIRPSEPGTVPVAKTLVRIGDQQVLVEEVRYVDLAPALSQLPQASLPLKPEQTVELAEREKFLRQPLQPSRFTHGLEVVSTQYRPNGVILDYAELSGSASSYTFTNNNTYHIQNSFSVGPGTASFQQNACIKLDYNAWLLVYAGVSCSSSGSPTILTSKDDNLFGSAIGSSTGNPGYAAAEGLWMYYQAVPTTLQNLRIRWSQIGIRYDAQYLNQPHLTGCAFEHCDTGVRLSIGGDNFYLSQDTYCDVQSPLLDDSDGATHIFGSIATDCGDRQFQLSELQHESTVTINPSNPSQLAIFAANYDFNRGPYGLLKVTSSDGGNTWSTPSLIATGAPGDLPTAKADVQAAYDAVGNLFLCYNAQNGKSNILAKSRDGGATWNVAKVFTSSNADRPVLATGPGGTYATSSVWVLYADGDHLTLAGAPVASDGTVSNFTLYTPGCSSNTESTGLAVGPTGKVVMAYETLFDANPSSRFIYINMDTDGLGPSQPTSSCAAQIQVNMGFGHLIPAQPDRGIYRVPVLAWDRNTNSSHYNRKYLAFTDTQTTGSLDYDTDVYVVYSDDDNGTNWSFPRLRVNDDATSNSQFFPGIAVDQSSGRVAVSWYDCRHDTQNKNTQFFAVVSTNGFSTQPRNFQLESTSSYSHTGCDVSHFLNYGDYTGLAFHAGYFFPAWCSFAGDACGEVHTCKVAW